MTTGDVLDLIRKNAVPVDRRQPWEWGAENVDFGHLTSFKGAYDVDNVPWTREFLRSCNNNLVRESTLVAPPQESGKTVAAELFLAFRISTQPTTFSWNTTTNVKAEQWSETRWERMLKSTKRIAERFSENKHEKKKRRIIFKDGTFLLIQGAETEGNRASDSVEVCINDEVYMWEAPWLKELHDRTLAYRETCKKINISVGGTKNSELHHRFLAGQQGEWSHHCPKCGDPFAYVFDTKDKLCNIRFDVMKAVVGEDGRLDLREFAKTVHVDCPRCGESMGYDRERLRRMNLHGVYVPRNPDADPTIESFHVNSFAIGRTPWHETLEPFVRMTIRGGVFDTAVLKEFITKPLADFWDERPFVVSKEIALSGFARNEVVRPGSDPDEILRIMACDNQRGARGDTPHRWFGAFTFTAKGRLRLIDGGRLNEWDALKKKQIELGIPDPTPPNPGPFVVVDRRYDPIEVDERCAAFKWYGMMGADQHEFVHPPGTLFEGTRQLFSDPRPIDVGYGTRETGRTYALYFYWSSQRVQSLVAQLRKAGMIEFPRDSNDFVPDLATHMNSHRQFEKLDRFNKKTFVWKRIGDTPDHLYDIVCMAVAVGCMAGLYAMPDPPPTDDPDSPPKQ